MESQQKPQTTGISSKKVEEVEEISWINIELKNLVCAHVRFGTDCNCIRGAVRRRLSASHSFTLNPNRSKTPVESIMNLNNFQVAEPRPMPVFVLADVSGSMTGEKIQTLNSALREMISSLRTVQDLRGKIEVAVITFGASVTVVSELTAVDDLEIPELAAAGSTRMGAALDCIRDMIERDAMIPARAFTPTVILVSDGIPTDLPKEIKQKVESGEAKREDLLGWPALKALHISTRAGKTVRLAMGIGEDADFDILQAFVNTPGVPVIRAQDSRGIERFFNWVTMSIASRSVSRNPNLPVLTGLDQFADGELVL